MGPHDPSDKRPKLERARSAAEKENLPLQRSGSMLRRQYSQQEQSTTRRMSTSDSNVDIIIPGQRRIQHQNQQYQDQYGQSQQQQQQQQQYTQYQQSSYQQPQNYHQGQQGNYPAEDPKYYQVCWDYYSNYLYV